MFCGNCGVENNSKAETCRGCGFPLLVGDLQVDGGSALSPPPGAPPPAPPARGKRRLVVAAAATAALVTGVTIFATGGATSTGPAEATAPKPETPAQTTSTAAPPSTVDVAALLPAFHEELKRLVAPRPDGPPALLVASSPRQDAPRPVTFTLIEWDRTEYHVADTMEIDCRFLEQLVVDEDQAMFLGCNGGASAHWAWAVLPDRLNITTLPEAGATDGVAGWLVTHFETVARAGQPDDLTLYGKRCEPSCAAGKIDSYSLAWDPTFRLWNLVACTPDGADARTYRPGRNGTLADLTYNGCPTF